ncbi:MAG: phospholipid carrier-dependent glycosyltransferase [bacterium]
MTSGRFSLPVLLVLSAACAFAFQGSRGLYDDTEGRYAEIAREMLATGNYLEPTLDHHPHWTKPPLTYWAIAGGIRAIGRSAWGVRLFNAVAFVITVLAVAACAGALWNVDVGFVTGLVYVSSFMPVIGASVVTPDTLLVMWETLAVLCYIKAYRTSSRSTRAWTRAMWVAFGLAFFTKGPPALVPCMALIVFHWHARRPFALFDLAGLSAFAVIGFWWFVLEAIPRPRRADFLRPIQT